MGPSELIAIAGIASTIVRQPRLLQDRGRHEQQQGHRRAPVELAVTPLSEHTVKTYVSSLLKKLRLARRAGAAAYVARQQHARAS